MRQVIEHVFGMHKNMFRVFDLPQYLHLFNQGVKIRRMFLVTFFMQNCFNCINGGACSYFNCIPPTLEEYIPLEEDLPPPPPVDLGTVYNYGTNNYFN